VLVAVALLASGCDWLQAGYGGERRFFNPFEPALTASSVGSLHQTFTVAEPVGAVGDPIVADGKLALASRDLAARTTQVSTWDATTGAARWTVTLPGSSVDVTNVVAASGRLFVVVGGADQSETVLALSIDDGSTVWSTDVPFDEATDGRRLGSLSVDGSQLLVEETPEQHNFEHGVVLTAVDTATGVVRWRAPSGGGGVPDTSQVAAATASGSYVAVSEHGFNGATEYHEVAVIASSGSVRWTAGSADFGLFDDVDIELAVGERFYGERSSTYGGDALVAWDAATGSLVWSVPDAGANLVAATDRTVFASTSNGVEARDAATGALRWTTPDAGGRVAIAGSVLYTVPTASGAATMSFFDTADGHRLGSVPVAGPGQPVIAEGHVYLATGQVIHAYATA